MSDRPTHPLDAEVEDDLGAAATLPGARSRDTREGRGKGKGRRRLALPRIGGRVGIAAIAALVVLLALIPAIASTLEKTPRDKYGISYGGGPIEGAHFQRTVPPGSNLFFNGLFDDLFLYPADQQSYLTAAAGDESSDLDGPVTAPSRDRVTISYQVAVYFKLNTDELRSFHEQIGLNYSAYTSSGWDDMIRSVFRPQIDNALQAQSREFDVADLFGDADVLRDLESEVEATLSASLEAALGGRYFCSPSFEPGTECEDPTFIIKRIDLPPSVLAAFERERTANIDIASREAEAQAIAAISDVLGPDAYPLLKAIESGAVSFWVLPDGGLTIAAPEGSTAAPSTEGGAGGEGGGG